MQIVMAQSESHLTLNAPIATKVVCFSRLLKCLRSLCGKSVDPYQTVPIGAVCSGSTLFASILNLSVMLGNYLQQTTSADNIFRCIFFLALQGLNFYYSFYVFFSTCWLVRLFKGHLGYEILTRFYSKENTMFSNINFK